MGTLKNITGIGLFVSVAVWITAVLSVVSGFNCLDSKYQCGGDELFISALFGVGCIVPSYLAGLICSFKRKGQ